MRIAYLRGLPVGRYVHQVVVGRGGECWTACPRELQGIF